MEYTDCQKRILDEISQELYDKNFDKLRADEKETVIEIAEEHYF